MKTIKRNLKQRVSLMLVVSILIGLAPQTMLPVWATDEGDMGDTILSEDMLEIEDTSELPDTIDELDEPDTIDTPDTPDTPDTIVIPILKAGEVVRTSHTDAIVKFTSDIEGQYYYNIGSPVRDTKESGQPCDLNEQTIEVIELEEGDQVIYIVLKDGEENLSSDLFTITIPQYLEEETIDDNIVNNFSTFGLTRGGSEDVYALLKNDNKLYETNEDNTEQTEVEIQDKKSITHLFVADEVTTIGSYLFKEYTSLTTVNMSNVTTIGFYAFYNCTSLTTVNMPKVTSIGKQAFYECISLTQVDMPKVTTIDVTAFYNCTSLTTVEMPDVTLIGEQAFYNCTSLTTVNMPKVTSIGKQAFYGCIYLTTVEMPDVTLIGESAFYNCTSLKTVNMPKVKKILSTTFSGCTALTTVNIPEATDIGSDVFNGCTFLTQVDMPKVTSIGKQAFYGCIYLTTVEMPDVTLIGESAFYNCTSLKTVEMAKVKKILSNAFIGCKVLTTVNMSTVETIGGSAFSGCKALTTVEMPNVTTIGNQAFYNCTSLKTAKMPKVKEIGSNAFSGCIALTTVNIPEATDIYSSAFNGCTSLTQVDMPKVIEIRKNVFNGCKALTTVNMPAVETIGDSTSYDSNVFQGCIALTTVDFPVVKSIGSGAFQGCTSLTTANVSTVETIGGLAFKDCKALSTIQIENATSIDGLAFEGCTSLTQVYIPKVTSINLKTFQGCTSLTEVNIPQVKTIGNEMFDCGPFKGCIALKTVNMPVVETIGYSAFENCTSLKTVSMAAVKSIGYSAFKSCTSLPEVDIPNAITIAVQAFSGCTALTTVKIPKVEKIEDNGSNPYKDGSFEGCTALRTIEMESVKSIGKSAFKDCTSLIAVKIPEAITIGDIYSDWGSFNGCTSLTTVEMPKVKSIGSSAFKNCTSLTTVYEPAVEIISNYAFQGCTSLTEVTMPYLNIIHTYVFQGCTSLITVEMLAVEEIYGSSFEDCTALTTVKIPKIRIITENVFKNCENLTTMEVPKVPPSRENKAMETGKKRFLKIAGGNTPESIAKYKAMFLDQNSGDDYWYGWPLYSVSELPTITTLTLQDGQVGESYSENLTATPDAPMIWYIEGLLPPGLTLDSETDIKTGVISGSPTTSGNYNFKVIAENAVGRVEKDLSIKIEKRNSYNVVYNGNGASGEMTSQKTTVGTDTIIKDNGFTRTGYTFKGWNTNSNGSGTSYAERGTIPSQSIDVTITLYAQWEQDIVLPKPKVEDFDVSNLKFTYDRTPKPVTVTPKNGIIGMGEITVKYKNSENRTYTEPPVNAGSYKILFDVTKGTKYGPINNLEIGQLKIEPKEVTLENFILSVDEIVNFSVRYPTIEILGIVEGDNVIVKYIYGIAYGRRKVGSYRDGWINGGELSNKNYKLKPLSGVAYTVIDKFVEGISITRQPKLNYSYPEALDLSDMMVTITYSDSTIDTDVKYSDLARKGIAISKNHGEKLVVSDTDSTIQLSAGEKQANTNQLVVSKTSIVDTENSSLINSVAALFDITGLSQTYDKTEKPVTVTPKSGITGMGEITVKYKNSENQISTTPPVNAGSYSILFDVAGGENFQAQSGISGGSLIISPKAITINDFVIGSIKKGVLSPLTLENPLARIEGIIEGDTCTITSAKANVNSSNPGNFTDARIDNIILSNENYIFVGNLENQNYIIQDRIVTNISLIQTLPKLKYQYSETMDWSGFKMRVEYDDNTSEENVGYERLEGLGVTTNFPQGTVLNVADTTEKVKLFPSYPDANVVLGQLVVEPGKIETVAVIGLVKPIAGQMPKEALQLDVPSGANYSIESIEYYVWQDQEPLWSSYGQAFKPNKKYKAKIELVPKTNYAFNESPNVTVGKESVEYIVKTSQSLIFDVIFKKDNKEDFITLPVKAPKIDVNRLNEIDVSSKGATVPLAINVSGLFPGYDEITWTIAETLDENDILTIPSTTTGTLINGEVDLGNFAVIANAIDDPLKTAKVTITFSGNTKGDYAELPTSTEITLNLEAGIVRPQAPQVDLSYTMERLIGIDNTMEYVIDGNDNYSSGVFTTFSGKTYSLTEIIPEYDKPSKYIHVRTKENSTEPSSELATIEIKARLAAPIELSGHNTSAIAGKILGTTELMQYRGSKGTTFIACTSDETKNLAFGIYQVRFNAKTTDFASKSVAITVPGAEVYEIKGSVVDEKDIAVSGARVKLMQGQVLVAEVTTESSGKYKFINIPNGSYNIVIVKDDKIVTRIVNIKDANDEAGIAKLPVGKKNSIVEVKDNTPSIVVGALDEQFNNENVVNNDKDSNGVTKDDIDIVSAGGSVTLKFVAESKDEKLAANSVDIKSNAQTDKKTINQFIDLSVTKVVTTIADETNLTNIKELRRLLKIIVPMDDSLKGKSGYVVYRYHEGKVDTIPSYDGIDKQVVDYFQIEGDSIVLYVNKFSTYAIGYTSPITPGTGNNSDYDDDDDYDDGEDNDDKPKIIVEENKGGEIKIIPGGNKIKIIPEYGYVIVEVIVDGESLGAIETLSFKDSKKHKIKAIFANKNSIPYYIKNNKKIYIGFSNIINNNYRMVVPAGVTLEFEENKKNFKDNTIAWAKSSIDFVTERDLFLGTSKDMFSPNESMTRAMFVTVIGRLYESSYGNISATNTFFDIDENAYYAKYVSWAHKNKIIKGIGQNKFSPNDEITREQMAVIMESFAKLIKKVDIEDSTLKYIDSKNISTWAIDGAKYCQETQVITGRDDGKFEPQESVTRAEVAVVIERFIKEILSRDK